MILDYSNCRRRWHIPVKERSAGGCVKPLWGSCVGAICPDRGHRLETQTTTIITIIVLRMPVTSVYQILIHHMISHHRIQMGHYTIRAVVQPYDIQSVHNRNRIRHRIHPIWEVVVAIIITICPMVININHKRLFHHNHPRHQQYLHHSDSCKKSSPTRPHIR